MITKKRVRFVSRILSAPFAWGFITAIKEMRSYDSFARTLGAIIVLVFSLSVSLVYIPYMAQFENYSIYAKLLFSVVGVQVVFAALWVPFLLTLYVYQKFQIWWKDIPEDVVRVEKAKKRKRISTEYTAMSDNPDVPVDILDEPASYGGSYETIHREN